jgi:hypothetical protein
MPELESAGVMVPEFSGSLLRYAQASRCGRVAPGVKSH